MKQIELKVNDQLLAIMRSNAHRSFLVFGVPRQYGTSITIIEYVLNHCTENVRIVAVNKASCDLVLDRFMKRCDQLGLHYQKESDDCFKLDERFVCIVHSGSTFDPNVDQTIVDYDYGFNYQYFQELARSTERLHIFTTARPDSIWYKTDEADRKLMHLDYEEEEARRNYSFNFGVEGAHEMLGWFDRSRIYSSKSFQHIKNYGSTQG